MKHTGTNRSEPFAARMVRHSSERCLNRKASMRVLFLRFDQADPNQADHPVARPNAVHVLECIAVGTLSQDV